ncbi:uncharacterized protein SOCE26_072940 [Sorangium cellulosum]|uniref:Uncharacterized protein n=1 Tax=Sorangium cellulosum TaxID=56 RepID=A0A2L0F2J4_SORCE|nr:hypothetical protein [Sorangium cellulosum]AUX45798.1 uncharacterized protein SOCE26_072940 [Sorangium cellulosum]
MDQSFDASVYVRAPIINIANGVTLASALVAACPQNAPENVGKACTKLKAAAEAAQKALTARRREKGTLTEEDGRALDREADASFGALRMRLVAYSMLPAERFPGARRAGELVKELFGEDGLAFLTAEYSVQNTVMASIVEHIQEAGLEAEIAALAGTEFLQQIGNVLPRYDMMVRDKLQREVAATSNLAAVVRAIQVAIVNYATKVAGMADEDEPETIETVRKALRPLDAHREGAARRAQGGAKGETTSGAPETPATPATPASPPTTAVGAGGGDELSAPV